MGAFESGLSIGAGAAHQQQQFQEANRIAGRNAQAALIENALNNPDTKPADRANLLAQHAALFKPHEAPDLFQRLSGLIHGQKTAASTTPAQPTSSAAPTMPDGTDGPQVPGAAPPAEPPKDFLGIPITDPNVAAAHAEPMHPMATSHPILDRFHEGLDALGHHLKGFSQPVAPNPQDAQNNSDVLARNYVSPITTTRESADLAGERAQKLVETKGTEAINLEKEKLNRYQLMLPEDKQVMAKYAADNGYSSPLDVPAEERASVLAKYHQQVQPKLTTAIVVDPDSTTGFSKVTGNQMSGEVVSTIPGITPPRGFIPTHRVTRTTDPATGLTTTSVADMSPQVPGGNAPAVGANAAPHPISKNAPQPPATGGVPTANATALTAINAGIQANKGKAGAPSRKAAAAQPVSSAAPTAPGTPRLLDTNDQIPASAAPSPQIREYAQDLLDDRDVDKIPAKARASAEQVARQYGWSQGAFTPREQRAINLTADFLDKFATSPSLKVLDSPMLRAEAVSALHHSQGMVGEQLQAFTARLEDPAVAEFVRLYNANVNNVTGASSTIRPGRPTEALVKRLGTELPTVLQSKDSADAKERIKLLQAAIKDAQKSSRLKGIPSSSGPQEGDTKKNSAGDTIVYHNGAWGIQ